MGQFVKFCQYVVQQGNKENLIFFDRLCILFIFADAVLIFLETFQSLSHYQSVFDVGIWVITGFFTVEYLVRITGHKNKLQFATSFYGIIDLIAFLPMYLTLGGFGVSYIRVFRLFRFLKFTKYIKSSQDILYAIFAVKDKLIGLLFFGGSLVYVFSITLFYLEKDVQPEKLDNVFNALYLAVVTITTLGYGDITPVTLGGKLLTGFFAVTSVIFVTIPTSLFLYEYQKCLEQKKLEEKKKNKMFRI